MTYNGIANVHENELRVTIAPLFETGSEKYRWLNGVQAIGLGVPNEKGIDYEVYRIDWY